MRIGEFSTFSRSLWTILLKPIERFSCVITLCDHRNFVTKFLLPRLFTDSSWQSSGDKAHQGAGAGKMGEGQDISQEEISQREKRCSKLAKCWHLRINKIVHSAKLLSNHEHRHLAKLYFRLIKSLSIWQRRIGASEIYSIRRYPPCYNI